jgi:hypothetical protein
MKRYLLTGIAVAAICMPAAAVETDSTAVAAALQTVSRAGESPFKLSAAIDMQVEKQLYDEYGQNGVNRYSTPGFWGYRRAFDDFWMRVALRGTYRAKHLEGAFAIRFYPYWTLRKDYITENGISGGGGADAVRYIDIWELTQAYIKIFKEYSPQENLTFQPHVKIGRDGLLNNCSQLFGNYLELPAGGFGDSRQANIAGPFKNRKVFANQIEAGFTFNVYNMVGGTTSLMVGGNVNNEQWYSKQAAPSFYQMLDSKLSAGFLRVYQDLFFLDKRIHIGGGFRRYSAPYDSMGWMIGNTYFAAQGVFDAAIYKDVKFYSEMAMQKMSSTASTGIVRPINMGITIPTFGVVDTLAVEFENVAQTFFSDSSMRDGVMGRGTTEALGWGFVAQKKYFNKIDIAWGLYSGNPYGDMKTTLRITSNF